MTGQGSTNLVYTILGFQTIIVIGFHHNCWWSSYQGLNLFFLQMKPKWYSSNFLNFFAICLEFSIRHWVGTKGNDNLYFLSFSAFSNQFMIEKKPYQFFFLIFSIFLQFFMNFLLRVWLEQKEMIIFIFPVSRSIPTYYDLKWSHNDIFIFSEFFFYFFGIFYYASCRNETER